MNKRNVHTFVMRFLEAYECTILEKSPSYVTAKLSPEADREMTGRPYYWSFVERTGTPAETMTYKFVFDPEQMRLEAKSKAAPTAVKSLPNEGTPAVPNHEQAPDGSSDSILGRYFGFVPTTITARVPQDDVTYGSRRLEQMFNIVRERGKFVHLFEEPFPTGATYHAALVYDTWFCVNYKVELACDRKRSEIHSLAIQLNNGEIRENFHKHLLTKGLSPKLPANSHILPDTISLSKAVNLLESTLERKVSTYDHRWADEANEQHRSEIDRVESFYNGLLLSAEPDKRDEIETQCRNRLSEIDWQHKPRIAVSVINCGLFHLTAGRSPRN